MSPFLVSKTGIGYEQNAYVWIGYGVWTQLWASLTLPLAWGFSWRAIRDGRHRFAAVALVSLTIALHFETGYLALLPLLLWPFVSGRLIATSARRAAIVAGGALLAAAWVIVPLIDQRPWAATNEALRGTALSGGYGAARVLGWLGSGQLLDHGRIPVVTAFAAIGLALALARWRADPGSRALVLALAGCLLLSFGRTTFGSLVAVVPGSGDIFFRRFMMGVQLAALLLAGRGAAWCGGWVWNELGRLALRRRVPPREALGRRLAWRWANPRMGRVRTAVAVGGMILVLAPAWLEQRSFDRRNANHIAAQRRADATQGAEVDELVGLIEANGGGRVYAGMPSNWGMNFTVGAVPVFKYLESRDVDEVGYTLRTAALMTGPEDHFDELDPSDYELFGIRYVILPSGSPPPVSADEVAVAGPYALWTTPTTGYVHVGTISETLTADRADLGARSVPLLESGLADHGDYLEIDFGGTQATLPPLPQPSRGRSAGNVISVNDDLGQGLATATVTMRRPGVVVLSASFDDGWTATSTVARRTRRWSPRRWSRPTSRRDAHDRLPLPGVFRLPGAVRAVRTHARRVCRRRRRAPASGQTTSLGAAVGVVQAPGLATVLGHVLQGRGSAARLAVDERHQVTLRVPDDRHGQPEERGAVPVLAAVAGGVDHLTRPPREDRLLAGGADVDHRERCLSGVEVERRPVGLPRLPAIRGRRGVLRLPGLHEREAVLGVGKHAVPEDLARVHRRARCQRARRPADECAGHGLLRTRSSGDRRARAKRDGTHDKY